MVRLPTSSRITRRAMAMMRLPAPRCVMRSATATAVVTLTGALRCILAAGELGPGTVVAEGRDNLPESTREQSVEVAGRSHDRPERLMWAIAIHGGAGARLSDKEPEILKAYHDAMQAALATGKSMLERGEASLDTVEAVIRRLEDDPLFNAGKGAVFNSEGEHELDASIMDGRTLAAGGVAGVRTVKNPIGLARRVMEKTNHILLTGAGAEAFATEQNLPRVANLEFSTDKRRNEWDRVRAEKKQPKTGHRELRGWQHYGTVGCVALDTRGHLAAGTSTGGLTNKKFGRVGDSPIIGAGTYADDRSCGISATGIGEEFIRHAVAAQISLLMRHCGSSLQEAAEYVLREQLRPEDGGIIGIDRYGQIVCVFTTPGMARAAADASGRHEVYFGGEGR